MPKPIRNIATKAFGTWFAGIVLFCLFIQNGLGIIKGTLWCMLAFVYLIGGNAPEGFW
jgi:hypothetical protein